MRPLCEYCKKRPAAVNYKKGNRVYYRKQCETCLHNGKGHGIPKWYKAGYRQLEVCEQYDLKPSDCYFLATTKDPYYKERRRMKWNDDARICITPLLRSV